MNDTQLQEVAGSSSSRGGRRTSTAVEQRPTRKSEHYGDAEFMDEQPRLTDLIPTRLPMLVLILVAGLAVIVGLEMLYAWMPRVAAMTTDGRVAAFDLDGEGSLAVWFSSMTLALAGLVAVVVYTVRRHRVDDYQGYYRIWLWAAMCWVLMSLDETSSLHEGFKEMMAHLTGTRLFGDGSAWWVVAYGFLLGAVGTRLLVDMRDCLLSSEAFVGTAVCYLVAVLAQLGWILPDSGARGVMLEEGAEMLGNLLLLLAMLLHARHVILDSQGRASARRVLLRRPSAGRAVSPVRKKAAEPAWDAIVQQKKAEVAEEEDVVEEDEGVEVEDVVEEEGVEEEETVSQAPEIKVHPPHGVGRPASRKALKPAAPPVFVSVEQAQGSVARKLTKAEKKALRRRLAKMKKDREQKGG